MKLDSGHMKFNLNCRGRSILQRENLDEKEEQKKQIIKEKYKMELLKQIEEAKLKKEREKQKNKNYDLNLEKKIKKDKNNKSRIHYRYSDILDNYDKEEKKIKKKNKYPANQNVILDTEISRKYINSSKENINYHNKENLDYYQKKNDNYTKIINKLERIPEKRVIRTNNNLFKVKE